MRTRRQRKKRMQKIAAYRICQAKQSAPAKPCEHGMLHLDEVPLDCPVTIYSRVSGREQERQQKIGRQARSNHRIVQDRGNPVVGTEREVAAGWTPERPVLKQAVNNAKKHGGIIVVESIDRLVRNEFYRDNNIEPAAEDFDQLATILDGVQVATICHPDTPRKGRNGKRSIEMQRGQSESGKRGGLPRAKRPGYKKQTKLEKGPLALPLFNGDAWMSVRAISRELNFAPQTVHDWIWDKQRTYGFSIRPHSTRMV